ncbi:hypothetical protein FH972_017830 [Carpinus fangiana]|uniref:Uncharacterized protein n=1 Tax=Carpinus fangiana TaxID=176857 RepID=A0A5N6RNI2_9ROSI|nr:hypothetical protein FH972_017830 [Carpinus fangiana]
MEEKLISIFNMHSKLNLKNNLTRDSLYNHNPRKGWVMRHLLNYMGSTQSRHEPNSTPSCSSMHQKNSDDPYQPTYEAIMLHNLRKSQQTRAQSYNATLSPSTNFTGRVTIKLLKVPTFDPPAWSSNTLTASLTQST